MSKQGLPVTQPGGEGSNGVGIRKRLSSSLHSARMGIIQQTPGTLMSALRERSKSVGDMEQMMRPIRRWWEWGWSWILSRKPTFANDLEMNEDEKTALGCHSKGTWSHIFYKVKSEFRRRLVGSDIGLPQTFK